MRNNRSQFFSLLVFIAATVFILGNGFVARIMAQDQEADVFYEIQPIGNVLDEVLSSYVRDPELDHVVEGAIKGMMNSLDDHSSYIPRKAFEYLTSDTDGEFQGIGVEIELNDDNMITVFMPIAGAPAAKAGMRHGDVIVRIDGISTKGMSLDEARDLIRGAKGTVVQLEVLRQSEESPTGMELVSFDIKRGTIPLTSVKEAQVLDGPGNIGYIRITDFKKTTAEELAGFIEDLRSQGMKSLVLDLRWNPGGLLPSAKEVSELFLPRGRLVTFTKGRGTDEGPLSENMRLRTERKPILPETFPMVILVNETTASSSEIVTGALQYWERAIVVGQKTYGKGSVQTIIPLSRPEGSAIRLTTALYYTPAEVTIDKQGILPDVEVSMSDEQQLKLFNQLAESVREDPETRMEQNHGSVTGNEITEDTVEDVQLRKAVEILREKPVFADLIAAYHKDVQETQREAEKASEDKVAATDTEPQPAG